MNKNFTNTPIINLPPQKRRVIAIHPSLHVNITTLWNICARHPPLTPCKHNHTGEISVRGPSSTVVACISKTYDNIFRKLCWISVALKKRRRSLTFKPELCLSIKQKHIIYFSINSKLSINCFSCILYKDLSTYNIDRNRGQFF